MSFAHELKYRGNTQVFGWQPTHAQPRPGLIEANSCVKRVMSGEKHSSLCVLSVSPDTGIRCVDTNFNPPRVLLSNTVYEIAHCGVDVSKPNLFTIIVGTKGDQNQFFCHVFKCPSKEDAAKVTRAVASACTIAFQNHQRQKAAQHQLQASSPVTMASPRVVSPSNPAPLRAASMKQRTQSVKRQGEPPKLTDSWFRPSMTRTEVSNLLRESFVGDFIVRESQTQPGDYAISVQTGSDIWTGLVKKTPEGFQLGTRGGIAFNELTDLISFYSKNKFMNDSFGNPLFLKLNYAAPADPFAPKAPAQFQQWENFDNGPPMASPVSSDSNFQRKPTFKNPPMLDASPGKHAEVSAPACGWPESSDEEDGGGINLGTKSKAVHHSTKHQAQPHLDIDLNEIEEALSALERVDQETDADLGYDNDFDPRRVSPIKSKASVSSEDLPPIHYLTMQVFQACTSDDEGFISGKEVSPLLLKSGLPASSLGHIWMEVDQDKRGKIDFEQLALVLGLIAQVQQGQKADLVMLDPDTIAPPTLDGFQSKPPVTPASSTRTVLTERFGASPVVDVGPVDNTIIERRGRVTF